MGLNSWVLQEHPKLLPALLPASGSLLFDPALSQLSSACFLAQGFSKAKSPCGLQPLGLKT